MKLLVQVILLSAFIFTFSCKTNKDVPQVGTSDCTTLATVKDFTGLDGCGLMVVLDNGDKLLPSKIEEQSFQLREGQRIKLNYKVLEDMMSICMAEKATIEITCIELIEGKPIIKECYDAIDVMAVPWMKEVVNNSKPSSIRKYEFRTDGWAYLFSTDAKQLFYDCQGTLLCTHDGLTPNQCLKKYVPGDEGKVIYSIRK